MKIDIHTHILPPEIPAFKDRFGYGGFIRLNDCPGCAGKDMVDDSGKFFRRIEPNAYEIPPRLRDQDEHGVRVQVLSTVPVMFSYWAKPKDGDEVARFLNDHMAEVVAKNPKRFVGLGTLPLQDPELAVAEVERGMKQLGLRGFQIGSHVNQWNLSDPALFPVYEACERTGAALFVHPWDMMGQERMAKYWLPWLVGMPAESSLAICSMIFGGVFDRFPKLRVAFAHGGGAFPFTLGRIQHGFDARPDLCAVDNPNPPKDYVNRFWVDSLVHDVSALRFLKDLFGAKKICLGTDYPFPLGELEPGRLIAEAGFSAEDVEWMNSKSALEWLNLRADSFV